MDERYRLRQWETFQPQVRSTTYTVEGSAFPREFHEESGDVLRESSLVHYLIVTNNDCIDVLSESEPAVRRVTETADKKGPKRQAESS